ncbi:uncharacterized protein N7483_006686 [Penicillium malachiteum]|uniref:uncharacterized protein n=1 Tax=Penicillium malachiteum TaxID=1324776 RepID=UPI002546D462|nr:uncharacterized protein N7483_006686 [Penicillium malachiteum]KAJ5725329.1 hypothetical protein N7483_006686 [Penicillium malachiteum]
MYLPRPRPKKTSITRTRAGCHSCRKRGRKCDETKPECLRCQRGKRKCSGYETHYTFLDVTSSTANRAEAVLAKNRSQQTNTVRNEIYDGNSPPRVESVDMGDVQIDSGLQRILTTNFSNCFTSPTVVSPGISQSSFASPSRCNSLFYSELGWMNDRDIFSVGSSSFQEQQSYYCCLLSTTHPQQGLGSEDPTYHIYHNHCHERLMTRLPPSYLPSIQRLGVSPMVTLALLSLSASNLANKNGSLKDRSHSYAYRFSDQSTQHFTFAFEYYQDALSLLHATAESSQKEPESCLLTAMLALLFEWESGSPLAVRTHIKGAEAIVLVNYRAISLTSSGRSLLCAWAEFHALWEAHLLPFRRTEIDKLISVPIMLAHNFADSRVAIYMICTDASFLSQRLSLVSCFGNDSESMSEVMQKAQKWYNSRFQGLLSQIHESGAEEDDGFHSLESLVALIPHFKLLLKSWHSALGPEDLPKEDQLEYSPDESSLSNGDGVVLGIEALVFKTYAAARIYLHYCAAEVMLSDDFISQLPVIKAHAKTKDLANRSKASDTISQHAETQQSSFTRSQNPSPMANLWADTVLRILAGMDWTDDAALSPYHENPFWTLWLVCSVCLDSQLIYKVLNNLLPMLRGRYPTQTPLLNCICHWQDYFSFLLQKLDLGWKPYLVMIPTPANQEIGTDQDPIFAIHGLDAKGEMVHFTERIPKRRSFCSVK